MTKEEGVNRRSRLRAVASVIGRDEGVDQKEEMNGVIGALSRNLGAIK